MISLRFRLNPYVISSKRLEWVSQVYQKIGLQFNEKPRTSAILNSNGIIRYKTLFQMSDETEEITARKDFSRFTRWWLADMNGEVKKN